MKPDYLIQIIFGQRRLGQFCKGVNLIPFEMRFHAKNNAVHLLSENGSRQVEIDQQSTEFAAAAYFIHEQFLWLRPRFRKSVQFICKPFFEAYLKAREKLIEAVPKEPIQKSGTLIHAAGDGFTATIFYDLETRLADGEMVANGRIANFGSHPDHALPRLIFYTHIADGWCTTFQSQQSFLDGMTDSHIINDILSLLLFLKFCPIETRVVAKGKKITHFHENYLNKTELSIEIVDSTWFTTIVRSEGFGVAGHFRLQPYGPGLVDRKLIWIQPYEKTGYVRRAKVLRAGDGTSE